MIRVRCPAASARRSNGCSSTASPATYANGTLRLTTRQTFQFHGVIKSNLKRDDAGDQRGAARHHRGLRRRQPQRDVRPPIRTSRARTPRRYELARAIAEHLLPQHAAPITRSGSTASASSGGEAEDGRADLRQDLPAAQVQDRGRGAAVQRRRRLRARPRLHRHRRRAGRASPAGTSPSAAAWA